ncbi:MAG: cation transporter [Sphingobacteriales bacterium]|nr:cation transporter [Sphingobacteriales bacterium]MBI3718406.1 cation transporter [Sphingobacteriales bacterium]
MSHQHNHDSHHHHHHHSVESANINRAFWIGIILNTAFVVIEFIAGFIYNSLALLSDAGHNLSDVAGLGLSLFAFKLAKAKSNERFTYGYHKGTILASLANAVILLIAVGSIGWEAIQRFQHPEETKGTVISIVAAIGIVINAASALLFFRNKEKDLNVKGAYLHLATDALVSSGVVIAGILITYTGIKWIDPLISLLIMAVVIYGTWSLLVESLKLSLDAVPEQIQLDKIKQTAVKIPGIKNIQHIHVWAMSTTKIAMTAHVIVDEKTSMEQIQSIKNELKHQLEHEGIQHVTIETECSNSDKEDSPC